MKYRPDHHRRSIRLKNYDYSQNGAYFITICTKNRELRNTPTQTIWQRNYYDHIICNNESLGRIRNYIVNNPLNWKYDKSNIFLS